MQLAPTLQMRAPRGWDLGQGPYLEEDSNRWGWEEPGLIIRSTKATSRVVHAQVGGGGRLLDPTGVRPRWLQQPGGQNKIFPWKFVPFTRWEFI